MKNIINKVFVLFLICFLSFGCNEGQLDLNPLSEGSSESWFSNDTEIRMSLDYLYTIRFWNPNPDPLYFDNGGWWDAMSDDWANRNAVTSISGGTINSETSFVEDWWQIYYTCVAAANLALEKLEDNKDVIDDDKYNQYTAEARFVRAAMYSKLVFYWGDVPYYTKTLSVDEAFEMGRTDAETVLEGIYDDFDYAASILPESWSGTQYATKGAALGLKARIALYMGDYETARDAAKSVIDLGIYELYSDYADLFMSKTTMTSEAVFSMPRSVELGDWSDGDYWRPENVRHITPRTNGGNMYVWPSWDLWNAYLCTDGLPIDESPLYDPHNPFENRDPRCTATLIEFGTEHGDVIFQPHPDSLITTIVSTGKRVANNDCRSVTQWASWVGTGWRKGYDSDCYDDFLYAPEHRIIRYADVLLIYAEAKIELDDIDDSVLEAINRVRARAYGVDYTDVTGYPALTSTDQTELRRSLRIERRMEFAFEGLRHADIIRWKLAEKVLNTGIYGMIDPEEQIEKIVDTGLWFFPEVVPVDEDGVSDFTSMYNNGYCKLIAQRSFDPDKHYLWPIPATEIQINDNLTQNPGY